MTNDEVRELARLLAKWASTEMDQWEAWVVETGSGPVYINLSGELPHDGRSSAAYQTIWPWPPHLRPSSEVQAVWVVFEHRHGVRGEVGRFDNRAQAEADVVAREKSIGGRYWIGDPAELDSP